MGYDGGEVYESFFKWGMQLFLTDGTRDIQMLFQSSERGRQFISLISSVDVVDILSVREVRLFTHISLRKQFYISLFIHCFIGSFIYSFISRCKHSNRLKIEA